jgi:hypothetical protein
MVWGDWALDEILRKSLPVWSSDWVASPVWRRLKLSPWFPKSWLSQLEQVLRYRFLGSVLDVLIFVTKHLYF